MTLPWPWWLILWLHRFALAVPWIAAAVVLYVVISLWRDRHKPKAVRGFLFLIEGGQILMPLTLQVGKTATVVLTEFDAQGVVVPPVTAPVYTSDTPAVATVAGNQVTAVGVGTANISGADAGDGITASDVLTVADTATTGKLTLTAN